MIAAKNSVVINRPVHEVYDYLREHENRIYWQPNLVTHEHSRHETGARVSEVRNVLGRRVEIDGEFTEAVADKRLTFKGQGPHVKRVEYHYQLHPEGDGTRLDTEVEVELADAFNLAKPVIQRMTEREIANAASLLKDVLEIEDAQEAARRLPRHDHHKKTTTTG